MEIRLRTTRTLKVTELEIKTDAREQLAQLYTDPRYEALLDVMERACISIETTHLNTPVGDPETVLGGHVMAKSAWLFFTYVQKHVLNAYHTRAGEADPEHRPSFEEIAQGIEGFAQEGTEQ